MQGTENPDVRWDSVERAAFRRPLWRLRVARAATCPHIAALMARFHYAAFSNKLPSGRRRHITYDAFGLEQDTSAQ